MAEIFRGPPAAPNFATSVLGVDEYPVTRFHREEAQDEVSRGPNFAGHYTLVSWGCGTSCHAFAIIDVKTGVVFDPPKGVPAACCGFDFRPDSALLVVDDARYYVWRHERLELIYPQSPARPLR